MRAVTTIALVIAMGCALASAARMPASAMANVGGVVTSLDVGRLTWRCDDARRFVFSWYTAPRGSEEEVDVAVGARGTRQSVAPGGRVNSPAVRAGSTVKWYVGAGSEAESNVVIIRVTGQVVTGRCTVRSADIKETTRDHGR